MLRAVFAKQIEPLYPNKRVRDSFVAKLVKAPAPQAAQKAGVYVLRLEVPAAYPNSLMIRAPI
jgi:hypothetical protein